MQPVITLPTLMSEQTVPLPTALELSWPISARRIESARPESSYAPRTNNDVDKRVACLRVNGLEPNVNAVAFSALVGELELQILLVRHVQTWN